MHLTLLDIFVVVLYPLLLVAASGLFRAAQPVPNSDESAPPPQRKLPWWGIGAALIAANISAEQIIGMSGSAHAFGLAVAAYEWMAALALILAGKFFLPVFMRNNIRTMPEFLRRRYGVRIQMVMAVFWLAIYIFVNTTATLWLGATAVHAVTGLTLTASLILLGLFAGNYALYIGMRATSATAAVQVGMLVLGGLLLVILALERIGGGTGISGMMTGFSVLSQRLPGHFHMILTPDNPFYKYAPGLAMVGIGMWVVNLCYWGFNQNIMQRALATSNLREAQKGVILAAFLKLLIPVIVVLPGIASVLLTGPLQRPDEAYPLLMTTLPGGLAGFVFAALVAAIITSMGATLSSIATICSQDVLSNLHPNASDRQKTMTGRFVAIAALIVSMATATPLLGHTDQAFQYIQEFTGFITPGVMVIFLLGVFWRRTGEVAALCAAVASVLLSIAFWCFLPHLPFIQRISCVFVICLALALFVTALSSPDKKPTLLQTDGVDYTTTKTYNISSGIVFAIVAAAYVIWW